MDAKSTKKLDSLLKALERKTAKLEKKWMEYDDTFDEVKEAQENIRFFVEGLKEN